MPPIAGSAAERGGPPGANSGAARPADSVEPRSAPGARGVHGTSQARARARTPSHDARRSPTSDRSTGRPPRSWPSRRSSKTASPFGSPARTSSAGPSASATAVLHDAVTGDEHVPLALASQRAARPSKSTTARSRRTPRSGSSLATTSRSRGGWWCGRRSTATSSTARRSCSTSS